MATTKRTTKVAKVAKKAKSKKARSRPCTPPEICKYLTELTAYLTFLEADYKALRIAMCNVEAQAFSGAGVAGKRFPPCGGGPGGDPIPPPPPPKWT